MVGPSVERTESRSIGGFTVPNDTEIDLLIALAQDGWARETRLLEVLEGVLGELWCIRVAMEVTESRAAAMAVVAAAAATAAAARAGAESGSSEEDEEAGNGSERDSGSDGSEEEVMEVDEGSK